MKEYKSDLTLDTSFWCLGAIDALRLVPKVVRSYGDALIQLFLFQYQLQNFNCDTEYQADTGAILSFSLKSVHLRVWDWFESFLCKITQIAVAFKTVSTSSRDQMNGTDGGNTEFYNDTDEETVVNKDRSHHGQYTIQWLT